MILFVFLIGNLAIISQKRATLAIDDRPMFKDFLLTAASQYILCIQLLNNLGDTEKEYQVSSNDEQLFS